MIRVIRGNPTPEELAAAVAVVQARVVAAAAADAADGDAEPAAWSDPARTMPRGLPSRPGPDAWRMSFRS